MIAGPVRLETDRLVLLAPLGADDAPDVARFFADNRAHFAPWDPVRPAEFFEPGFWRAQLAADADALAADQRVRFFARARSDGAIVGFVHFANVVRGAFQACHLGFGVGAAHLGQGLMREALEAAIAWAFAELGLHRIEANHRPENVRSAGLLRRLGFAPQGYARDYLRIDGAWRDHVLTARTNPAWVER